MVNPTAYLAGAGINPGVVQGVNQGLSAIALGQQAGQQKQAQQMQQQATNLTNSAIDAWKKKDRQGYQTRLRELSAIDPKAANDVNKTFTNLDWNNLVETGYNVYAAAASDDINAQNKLLDNSIDILGAGPEHWMTQGLQRMRNLPAGQERTEELLGSVEMLKNLGVFPKEAFGGEKGKSKAQKTGSYLVELPDGSIQIATGVFDPDSKELTFQGAPLPKGAKLLSREGETPEEKKNRQVATKQMETRVVSKEKRAGEVIDQGLNAAESVAGLKRGIELLDEVKTGGVNAIALRAKQLFGIETADEGELSNQLSKAVLSQLRSTFGAAFTEKEGLRLERIEAGFGKSVDANKRLLNQALRMAERKALRARKIAEETGDDLTVQDIDDFLSFSYSQQPQEEKPQQPMQQGAQGAEVPAQTFRAQDVAGTPTVQSMQAGEVLGPGKRFIFDGVLYEN